MIHPHLFRLIMFTTASTMFCHLQKQPYNAQEGESTGNLWWRTAAKSFGLNVVLGFGYVYL